LAGRCSSSRSTESACSLALPRLVSVPAPPSLMVSDESDSERQSIPPPHARNESCVPSVRAAFCVKPRTRESGETRTLYLPSPHVTAHPTGSGNKKKAAGRNAHEQSPFKALSNGTEGRRCALPPSPPHVSSIVSAATPALTHLLGAPGPGPAGSGSVMTKLVEWPVVLSVPARSLVLYSGHS
jgi:hypothetical protein